MAVPVIGSVTVKAVLSDAGSNLLANQTMTLAHKLTTDATFTPDGTFTTDANGIATVVLSLAVPATYDFKADFAATAQYKAFTVTLTAIVIAASTSISLTVAA